MICGSSRATHCSPFQTDYRGETPARKPAGPTQSRKNRAGVGRGRGKVNHAGSQEPSSALCEGFPEISESGGPSETWSGRGKQPRWLVSALKAGGRIEDFAIPAAHQGKAESAPLIGLERSARIGIQIAGRAGGCSSAWLAGFCRRPANTVSANAVASQAALMASWLGR